MLIQSLESLAGVVLVGSLAMERLVTTAKTAAPSVFGDPGPGTGESLTLLKEPATDESIKQRMGKIHEHEKWRRVRVLLLVYVASFGTALLVSSPVPAGACSVSVGWLCRTISYGRDLSLDWWLYAVLISGGSAFWTNIVGFASALKDVKAAERQAVQDSSTPRAMVFVVDPSDKPRLEAMRE